MPKSKIFKISCSVIIYSTVICLNSCHPKDYLDDCYEDGKGSGIFLVIKHIPKEKKYKKIKCVEERGNLVINNFYNFMDSIKFSHKIPNDIIKLVIMFYDFNESLQSYILLESLENKKTFYNLEFKSKQLSHKLLYHTKFVNCTFHSNSLDKKHIEYCKFYRCKFLSVEFSYTNDSLFSSCIFNYCWINRTHRINIWLRNINFFNSKIYQFDFSHCRLFDINFEGANILGCKFAKCLIRNTNFTYAQIEFCKLKKEWIRDCVLDRKHYPLVPLKKSIESEPKKYIDYKLFETFKEHMNVITFGLIARYLFLKYKRY